MPSNGQAPAGKATTRSGKNPERRFALIQISAAAIDGDAIDARLLATPRERSSCENWARIGEFLNCHGNSECPALDRELADAACAKTITDLSHRRAQVAGQLAKAEAHWLDVSERLELLAA